MRALSIVPAQGNPWSEVDERELIALAPADPSAFGELYRRDVDRVFQYLLTFAGTPEDAADLTQHVFLRALQSLPSYRDHGLPFRAWLLRIARNAATDAYRRRRRALQPVIDGDPLAAALRHEALNRLRILVAELPEEKQDLLALRFAGGLTAAEIAAVVGASEAAVQKQLTRTMRALREQYGDER